MLKQTWQEQKSILFLSVSCGSWCCVMGVNHTHTHKENDILLTSVVKVK